MTIDDLVFKAGKSAVVIHHSIHSARLTDDTSVDSPGGDTFTYKLIAQLRVIRAEVERLRLALLNHRVHVVLTFRSKEKRIIPFMRLWLNSDTGAKLGVDRPGYVLNGTSKFASSSGGGVPFIGDEFEVPPTPTPPSAPEYDAAEVVVDPVSTSSATLTRSIPSGVLLMAVWLRSNAAQEISVGLSPGGDELGGPQFVAANQPISFAQAIRTTAATDVHISGMTGANSIEFWYAQLGAGDVIKVVIISTAAEAEFTLPSAVLLTAVWIKGDTEQTVSIGLTSGGDELGGPQLVFSNTGQTFSQTLRTDAPTSIFISGLSGANSIEIWYAI